MTESINLIISNYFYINGTLSIPSNTLIKIFEILLQQLNNNSYNINITVLFQAIFDLFDKIKYFNFRKEIQNFFQTNGDMIIQLILKNLSVFNLDSYFKIHKLDLKYSDQDLIFAKFKSIQNYCILIYFLQYSCINVSTEKLKKISPNLNQFLNFKIKENDWNEVMLITNFLKS